MTSFILDPLGRVSSKATVTLSDNPMVRMRQPRRECPRFQCNQSTWSVLICACEQGWAQARFRICPPIPNQIKIGWQKVKIVSNTSRSLAALCSLSFLACLSFGSSRRASLKSATEPAYFPRLWRTIPLRIQAFLNAGSKEIALRR